MRILLLVLLHQFYFQTVFAQKVKDDRTSHLGYIQGYYYSNSGLCVDGLIRFEFNQDNYFLFKLAYGEKSTKVRAKDIQGFVILADSFAIIKNFEIDSLFSRAKSLSYKEGFAQVLETGELNLLKHQAVINFRIVNTYLLYKTSDESKKLFTIRKRDAAWFAEELSGYLKDDEATSKAIKSKELQFKQLQQIVRAYNKNYAERN